LKAVLELELIGDSDPLAPRAVRPWVARILGLDEHTGLQREFLRRYQKDYSRANSIGSRGVYAYYVLDPGLYEVSRRVSWSQTERYFACVDGATITRISREEVVRRLSGCSA
jgi:hypothetical protein